MLCFQKLLLKNNMVRNTILLLFLVVFTCMIENINAASSSSSGSTGAVTKDGNHSSNMTSDGLHPHAAGGQGEIHFISFVLFAGFLFIKGKNKIICCKRMIPYTVQLLLFGVCIGVIHNMTLHDYSPENKLPFPSGCVDPDALTCTSAMTGSFFKFDILESIDPHAVMFIFLPPLIFESAFYADGHIFIKSFKTIVSMAGIGVIIASVVTMLLIMIIFPAYTLNENIDYSIYGFTPTILPAMLLGVTLSATDPVAVVSLLNSLGAPKELGTMIEGESLLNDGTAYGFFLLILKLMRSYYASLEVPHLLCDEDPARHVAGCVERNPTPGETVGFFFLLIFVAGIVGSIIGSMSRWTISMIYDNKMQECLLTIMAAYSSWIVAEAVKASGVLAVVACGIVMGMHKENISASSREFIEEFWETVCFILNTILFVMTGVIIGSKLTTRGTNFDLGLDLLLMIIVYFVIHIARALSILTLQPCLNKSGSFRCCKGKYATYDFDNTHSIVMWWGGLRGAVGLALGLIVSSDELWKEMDIAYCNEHPCCQTTCKIRQRYYQTAFSDVFLIHVSFIVLLTIVFNGVSTATVVKRLGLSKKESKLEHLNFDRICTEIDEKLKERKEELQREDVIHVGHTKKGGYHADWNIVFRYLPIPTETIYKQRLSEGLISNKFGSAEDVEMPPRLFKRWRGYHEKYGGGKDVEQTNRDTVHKVRTSAINAIEVAGDSKKNIVPSADGGHRRASSKARRRSVVEVFSEEMEKERVREARASGKSTKSVSAENANLREDALVLADLRIKYCNMVIEKYWHLVSEGYLQMEHLHSLKNVEELQKDSIDEHLATLSQLKSDENLTDEEKDAFLAGGRLLEFTKHVQKNTEPWPILIFGMELFSWFPPIQQFISDMLSLVVTRDYSMIENFAHAHKTVQHELFERHEGEIEDDLLMRIIDESNTQLAEAIITLEGMSEAYEKIIERHQTVVAAEVMLENHKMLVKEKEEEGEIDAGMAHKLFHMINISHKKLKCHPYPTACKSTLKEHIEKAVIKPPEANMISYCFSRMSEDQFMNFTHDLHNKTNQSPIYLKAYELVYMKGKSDLHLGLMSDEHLGLYLVLKGKVSVVHVMDDVEEDFEEREKHYHEILKRNAYEKQKNTNSSLENETKSTNSNDDGLNTISENENQTRSPSSSDDLGRMVKKLSESEVDLDAVNDVQKSPRTQTLSHTKTRSYKNFLASTRMSDRRNITDAFTKWIKSKPKYDQPQSLEELMKEVKSFQRNYRSPRTVEKAMAQTAFLTMNRTLSKAVNKSSKFVDKNGSNISIQDSIHERKNIYNHLRAITKSRASEEKLVTEIETVSSYQTFGEYELNGEKKDRTYTAICDSPCLLFYIERPNLDALRKKYKPLDDYLIMRALWSNANLYLRDAFSKKPPLYAAFENFSNGKIYHGKPGNSNENIIDIAENMFLLHMTRSGARIGFSPGATPPMPYKLMSDEIAVLFCADDENVDRKTSKHDTSLLRELSKVEKEVIEAINLARSSPSEMKKIIEERLKLFDSDGNLCFDWGKIPTQDGKAGYEAAIEFLSKQMPLPKVEISNGMNGIAREVSRSGGTRSRLEHATEEDIRKYGKSFGYIEHIEYGPWKDGVDFVISLIVDDGNPLRGERKKLFQTDLFHCGACVGKDQDYGKSCVMNFATRFTEFKTQKGKNELDVKKASPDNDSSVEENLKKNDEKDENDEINVKNVELQKLSQLF